MPLWVAPCRLRPYKVCLGDIVGHCRVWPWKTQTLFFFTLVCCNNVEGNLVRSCPSRGLCPVINRRILQETVARQPDQTLIEHSCGTLVRHRRETVVATGLKGVRIVRNRQRIGSRFTEKGNAKRRSAPKIPEVYGGWVKFGTCVLQCHTSII